MPRSLDSAITAQLESGIVGLAMFLQIQFKSQTSYVSTLPFDFTWGGNTWTGTGAFGKVSTIEEGLDIEARGVTVSLSGIDSSLLSESLTDIKLGGSAKLYLGIFAPGTVTLVADPVCIFAGIVDQPNISMSDETVTISLSIESSLIRLQRACNLMLTSADQRIAYADDTGLDQVPLLNWMALRWGA